MAKKTISSTLLFLLYSIIKSLHLYSVIKPLHLQIGEYTFARGGLKLAALG